MLHLGPYVQDKEVEAKVYEQMSLVSCAVGFSWSKWSSEVGEQQFVVRACEQASQQQVSAPGVHIVGLDLYMPFTIDIIL